MAEFLPLLMFLLVCAALLLGYPVAFTLAGVALWCAGLGILLGHFDAQLLLAYPDRVFGVMTNTTLIAVPLFVFMGVMLERSKLAEDLLENMAKACGHLPGGLGVSVILVGALLAASTGIVGATVVTMGLISLPTMLRRRYSPELSTGLICATGTLGQIIPPSIALVLLGDILSSAHQQTQLAKGVFNATPLSLGDLFVGALLPGLLLVVIYLIYVFAKGWLQPHQAPRVQDENKPDWRQLIRSILPPILLILLVLGSIIGGAATPTEAAGVGAVAATLLALAKRQLCRTKLAAVMQDTACITAMVFSILLAASVFSLVFRGLGGEHMIETFFQHLPGGVFMAMLIVMAVIFVLGFILDFIEITFVVVPLVAPSLLAMGLDPVWLGIMIALNLQTSFLTPPFGFALFYLRGVAPPEIATRTIYRGVMPFIAMQLLVLCLLALWPEIATWLPAQLAQ
jgi:tripartite ATP-independent transporter DctM subunit